MTSDVSKVAQDANLSPIVRRVALVLADIAGEERALRFVEGCKLEDDARRTTRLDVDFVPG